MTYFLDWSKSQGTAGVEPATSRSAVECSATELYPRLDASASLKTGSYLSKRINKSCVLVSAYLHVAGNAL